MYNRSYGTFSVKIFEFSLPWQQVSVGPNLTGIVLADPETHTIEPKITTILYTTGVMANLLLKFPNFHYHGNWV